MWTALIFFAKGEWKSISVHGIFRPTITWDPNKNIVAQTEMGRNFDFAMADEVRIGIQTRFKLSKILKEHNVLYVVSIAYMQDGVAFLARICSSDGGQCCMNCLAKYQYYEQESNRDRSEMTYAQCNRDLQK